VLFRHEKTFYHRPGLLVRIKDTQPQAEAEKLAADVANYKVDYVGMSLQMDGLAIENASGDPAMFANCVAAVQGKAKLPLVLMSKDPKALEAALTKLDGTMPLLYAADALNWQAMAELAKKARAPLAIRATPPSPSPSQGESWGGVQALAELSEQVKGAGIEDIVLDPGVRDFYGSLAALTQIRRLALKKNFRLLGFPIITFPGEGAESPAEEALLAGQHIAKYSSFVVLDHFSPAMVYPLLLLRQNIYTDPQKPIQVQPGIYEINAPKPESPAMCTTNFSITYFAVANEVEGSGWPGWLLVVDAEGMSVLTGWAAGKFDAERIAKAVKSANLESKIGHKKLIIPGAVAVLMGELEEELPGWEIMVGPREAVGIPNYLKVMWK
jgi:acetyl-CoA decarbonylase/synthase complex subunit gamma